MGEARDPSSIRPLIRCLLHDTDSKVRALAGTALVELGEEAAAQLVEAWRAGQIQGKRRQSAAKGVLKGLAVELPADLGGDERRR